MYSNLQLQRLLENPNLKLVQNQFVGCMFKVFSAAIMTQCGCFTADMSALASGFSTGETPRLYHRVLRNNWIEGFGLKWLRGSQSEVTLLSRMNVSSLAPT